MRSVLYASFAAIVMVVAASNLVGRMHARQARARVVPALENAFASIDLVSRISRDFSRERLLVDTHIVEKERTSMERIATQVAAVERDISVASAAYQKLVVFDNEREVWRWANADLEGLRQPVDEVMQLSLVNRDVEAQQQMDVLDARFVRVNAELGRLVEINRAGGLQAISHAESMQRSANFLNAALVLVAIVLTIGVGGLTTHLITLREDQLMRYSARLEQQNRELDAFAGRVAHDLRGPLTTMSLGAARMIEESHEERGVGAMIRRSVGRMERLIHDLLALSQVETQSLGASCDPAAVSVLVRDELAARAEAAQATVRVDVVPARVQARDGLLLEALTNLADNALKYARPEEPPRIEIVGRVVDERYELSVADNGLGMAPEEARQAFEPFYRAQRAP
ncbi:MAG TPA: ATP-binding protein, partial [Polyangia bacterium]